VENEVRMISDARDYSNEANDLFNSKVPDELINYLQKKEIQPMKLYQYK